MTATQKFSSLDFFGAHWYDSCHSTVLKIISNEIKDSQALLEPSYDKK